MPSCVDGHALRLGEGHCRGTCRGGAGIWGQGTALPPASCCPSEARAPSVLPLWRTPAEPWALGQGEVEVSCNGAPAKLVAEELWVVAYLCGR